LDGARRLRMTQEATFGDIRAARGSGRADIAHKRVAGRGDPQAPEQGAARARHRTRASATPGRTCSRIPVDKTSRRTAPFPPSILQTGLTKTGTPQGRSGWRAFAGSSARPLCTRDASVRGGTAVRFPRPGRSAPLEAPGNAATRGAQGGAPTPESPREVGFVVSVPSHPRATTPASGQIRKRESMSAALLNCLCPSCWRAKDSTRTRIHVTAAETAGRRSSQSRATNTISSHMVRVKSLP